MGKAQTQRIGVVAIGRNEGRRLVRCLASLGCGERPVVYVDSGSTDGSVSHARQVGAEVVELDVTAPFTAARARNAGFERLMERWGQVERVQFVDGDCELADGWLERAAAVLAEREDAGIVCGRLREARPGQSVYHRLLEMEWHRPVGEDASCGGIFMIRSGVFGEVGGFNESMIAGEEPELCARVRGAGWKVVRVADEMGRHEAGPTRFTQWWRRSVRNGHAFMDGYMQHRGTEQAFGSRQVHSNWFWGIGLPTVAAAAAYPTGGGSVVLLAAAYAAMVAKIARGRVRRMGEPWRDGLVYGGFVMLGKLPGAVGQMRYWINRWRGRRSELIEYKGAEEKGEKVKGAEVKG